MNDKTEVQRNAENFQNRQDHMYSPGWLVDARNWIIPTGDRWPVKVMKILALLILLSWLVVVVQVLIAILTGNA